MTEKYPDVALNMRTRITITGLSFLDVAAALLNIQQSSLAFAAGEEDNNMLYVRKENITTDIIELVSGIFAAILFALSLRTYRKLMVRLQNGHKLVYAFLASFPENKIVTLTTSLRLIDYVIAPCVKIIIANKKM